jgi:transposase
MPKPYSEDLRERVIEAVESGASRREAAENFRLSPSSAVRWWRRWRDTGSAKAKPSGGSKSPLEEHAEWLLALVAQRPVLTLDEIVTAMHKRRIPGSRTAVWRFFERHNLTFRKTISDGVTPVGVETVGLYRVHGRERPSAFWWRVTP